MTESQFQRNLIKELECRFPGSVVTKIQPYIQGIPDLLILWHDRWGMLECKRSGTASVRPNQSYYVDLLNSMSFAAFIFPENKDEVLDDLEQAFKY